MLNFYEGWSAGGSISIQVAKCLDRIPELEVAGIIMLDTPFPDFPDWRPKDAPPIQFHNPLAPDEPAKNMIAQQQAVNDIIHALSIWEQPSWDDTRLKRPPPTVFIRALEVVPTEKVVEVDWFREEPCLGWHKYPYNFILEEFRVEGDHFSMFSAQCLPDLNAKIRAACQILESSVAA
ncbi:putative thioesterase boa10 [Clarireedia jacksonii]